MTRFATAELLLCLLLVGAPGVAASAEIGPEPAVSQTTDALERGPSGPAEQWNRTYGDSGKDMFSATARADGGYLLVGWTERNDTGEDGWAVKVNETGTLQWERTFTGPESDRLYDVGPTADGGFLVVGQAGTENGRKGLVAKIGPQGERQWERKLARGALYGLTRAESGYLAVGQSRTSDGVGAWAVKLNAAGETTWERTYDDPASHSYGFARAVVSSEEGGYVLGGVAKGGESDDVWALRIDSGGDLQWQRTYGGSERDTVWAMARGADGYVLAGETESNSSGERDGWALNVDENGALRWERRVGGDEMDWLDSAMRTDDGYLFTGATQTDGVGGTDGYVVRTDANGTVESEVTFGSAGWDKPWPAIRAHDGGYLLAGATSGFGAEGIDGWVVRIASDGATADRENTSRTARERTSSRADGESTTAPGQPGFTVELAVLVLALLLLRRT